MRRMETSIFRRCEIRTVIFNRSTTAAGKAGNHLFDYDPQASVDLNRWQRRLPEWGECSPLRRDSG